MKILISFFLVFIIVPPATWARSKKKSKDPVLKMTFPMAETSCHLGDKKFEVLIRMDHKPSGDPEEAEFGANMVFIKTKKGHILDPMMKPYDDSFRFVKPNEGSLCEKTQAFEMVRRVGGSDLCQRQSSSSRSL